MALDCNVVRTLKDLIPFEPAWRDLLDRASTNEPTLTPLWIESWWRVFGASGGRRLRVALFSDGDRLVGIAPLLSRPYLYRPGIPFRRLELLGSGEPEYDEICSDYLGIIAERGREVAVMSALAAALAGNVLGAWDELVLPAMAGGESSELLAEELGRAGIEAEIESYGACPYIALPRRWEDYLAALPAAGRYVVNRSLRNFDEWANGSVVLHEAHTEADLELGKGILKNLHIERWGARGVFRSARFNAFHEAVMPSLFAEDALELLWLTVRGIPIAAAYNIRWKGKIYFYQSGRKLDVPRGVRPGIVLHARAIRHAIERGRREYDFLAGPSQYKRQLATGIRPLVRVRAVRASIRERARRATDRGLSELARFRRLIADSVTTPSEQPS